MKIFLILISMSALTVTAQPPPADNPSDVSQPTTPAPELRASGMAGVARTQRAAPKISGALVQAARNGNPAQMINPFAPQRFGDGYANVSVDPISGKGQGIRLFTISF